MEDTLEAPVQQPPDKLQDFYNSLKANENIKGLPDNYNSFKSAMQDPNKAKAFHDALLGNESVKGLPSDFNQFSTALGLKKGGGAGSPLTSPQLSNGLNPFQNSQQPELTPFTDPKLKEQYLHQDDAVRAQRQAQVDKSNELLKGYMSKLSPEEKQHVMDINAKSSAVPPDKLSVPTQQEQDDYAYSQTPTGKIVNGAKYLAQRATKGGLQVLKGAAYLATLGANARNGIVSGDDPTTDAGFNKADKATDFLSKGDQSRVEDSKSMSNIGGIAEFLPAAIAGESTGGATFYLQGMGQGKEIMDNAEKGGAKINPIVKNAFILGTGAINGLLMGDLGKGIFKPLSNGLKDDVVANITVDAIKKLSDSGIKEITPTAFKTALETGAKEWTDKALQGGVNFLKHTKKAITDLSALNAGNFALKQGVDATSDKPVFNENLGDLANQEGETLKAAPMFGAIGSMGDLSKLTPFSGYKNAIVDGLMKNSSDENVAATKDFVQKHGEQQGWTPEQIEATKSHVDEIAKITKSLPPNIPTEKVEKAVDLVQGRNELQKQLETVQARREGVDPALQDIISPHEQLLTDKIDQANDKLRDIATGKRTTYSKERDDKGEETGKFLKTVGGKSEEISQSRYDLEKTERDANVTPNEQTEPNQEIPVKQPADEAISAKETVNPNDETTKNNQIITNSKQHESTNEKGDGKEKADAEKVSEREEEAKLPDEEKVSKSGTDKTVPEITDPSKENDKLKNKIKEIPLPKFDTIKVPDKISLRNIKATIDAFDAGDYPDMSQSDRDKLGDYYDKVSKIISNHEKEPENDRTVGKNDDQTGKEPQGKPKISEQAKTLADKIRSLKSDKNQLHGGLQGVAAAIYDGGLETAATVIEQGGKLVDAIDAAIKHIKANSDQKDEDKIRAVITKDLADAGIEDEKQPENTGITNKDVEKERGKAVDRTHKTKEQIDAEGKRLIDSGEMNPDEFAKKIIDKPYPATAEEESALLYHKTKLKNANRNLAKDPTSENQVEYAKNEDLIERNRQATEIIRNELGRGLGAVNDQLKEDYSRVRILERAKMANNGEPLNPKDEAELIARTKRIEELENKLADTEERLRKSHEDALVNKVNRTANFEERTAKREVTKASLRKEREGLVAELHLMAKNAMKSAGANKIPVEMIVPLTKLARNYVLDGATTLSAVVDKLYNDLKDHIEGIDKNDIADIVKENFDKYLHEQNQIRLDRSKKLQGKKLEKLKEQNATGDFEKTVNRKISVDNDYLTIRADINREQTLINKKIDDIQNSNKSLGRKIVDLTVKYGRQAKLASITVLGKLAATGLTTMGLKGVTEGVGAGISKLLPKIAKKSTVEGGFNVKALAQSYAKAATIGMKDAYDELNIKKGGQSDLSALYGKYLSTKLPAEAADFFGHLHSAIKAPIKRQAWEYSYAKRVAKGIEQGIDVQDPVIDATNRLNAYKDAERAIFMGDNKISSLYEANMKTLENSNSPTSKNIAAISRILLPFVKVPTNIVLSTGRYAFGLVPGLSKLSQVGAATALRKLGAESMAKVIHSGMGELTSEESDMVLRNLKHGTVGGAALLLGFFNPKNVGGFYQPGEKRKANEVKEGALKLFGHRIPAFLTEHPIFQAMQIGATFRRFLDAHRHQQGNVTAATLATASGLAKGIPLANEANNLLDILNSKNDHKLNTFIANTVKGEIEPSVINQIAQAMDTKNGDAFTLNPDNMVQRAADKKHGVIKETKQELESGIPVLRKQVPRKH